MNDSFIQETDCNISLCGEELLLLPEKAVYWKRKRLLLIADLHLGKTTHFRNNGIAVPQKTAITNWTLLRRLFDVHKPERVCFLGDLFHSIQNKEWETFGELLEHYSGTQFELIMGNHDILPIKQYKELKLVLYKELREKPFLFTHEPAEKRDGYYNIAGHIHPGVKLKGKGKQKHRLACFYFGKTNGIIPAFGAFTGLATLSVKKGDQVYIIANQQVIKA